LRAALLQTPRMTPTLRHGLRILASLATAIAWGVACGTYRAPFWAVLIGGLGAAALGFWLERDVLAGPDTAARKDFPLILAAGYGFFAIVGVGLVSVGYLIAVWYHL
jgi:hypothetical protein